MAACGGLLRVGNFVNPFETPSDESLGRQPPSTGLLIHAGLGSAGGSGAFRTNRSGWAA